YGGWGNRLVIDSDFRIGTPCRYSEMEGERYRIGSVFDCQVETDSFFKRVVCPLIDGNRHPLTHFCGYLAWCIHKCRQTVIRRGKPCVLSEFRPTLVHV